MLAGAMMTSCKTYIRIVRHFTIKTTKRSFSAPANSTLTSTACGPREISIPTLIERVVKSYMGNQTSLLKNSTQGNDGLTASL